MDIRIDTKFLQHPKTMKLQNRLGPEGVLSLLRLWLWAAENRPSGVLHGLDEEDVDLIARGPTRPDPNQTSFCTVAIETRWMERTEEGELCLHEWADHNPWAADAPNRSDKARFSKLASVAPAAYFQLAQEGKNSITAEEYRSLVDSMSPRRRRGNATSAPSLSPSLSPSPDIERPTVTKENEMAKEPDPLKRVLLFYRRFPGYRAELETKEREWLEALLRRFPELDVLEELEKAKRWIELKQDFQVKNSRAYITKWLERVQKERM